MSDVSRDEFNGLGTRVNEMAVILSKTEERSERNEEDVKNLYDSFEAKSQQFSAKADKISNSVVLGSFVLVVGLIVKEAFLR
jgi:hypothetical protein